MAREKDRTPTEWRSEAKRLVLRLVKALDGAGIEDAPTEMLIASVNAAILERDAMDARQIANAAIGRLGE